METKGDGVGIKKPPDKLRDSTSAFSPPTGAILVVSDQPKCLSLWGHALRSSTEHRRRLSLADLADQVSGSLSGQRSGQYRATLPQESHFCESGQAPGPRGRDRV